MNGLVLHYLPRAEIGILSYCVEIFVIKVKIFEIIFLNGCPTEVYLHMNNCK